MKSIIYLLIAFTCISLANCKKVDDSLGGSYILAGKIMLTDSINGNTAVAETDSIITVQLYETENPAYFIYETKTSGKGNFKLDFLKSGVSYKVSASAKINGVEYKGQRIFKVDTFSSYSKDRKYYLNLMDDTVKLVLNAVAPQRTFNVVVHDANNIPVYNASVCVFNSPQAFNTRNCANAFSSKSTDIKGKTSFAVPANGVYYIYASKVLYANNDSSVSVAIDTVTIADNQIPEPVTLVLNSVTQAPFYRIELLTYDSVVNSKNALPSAEVCLFKSRQLFNTRNCANANFSTQSDALGKVTFNLSDTGKYFVYAQKTYYTSTDTFKMEAIDSVHVNDPVKALHLK